MPFLSRRSPVLCRHACVATSQPLASSVGYDILKAGGNAAYAAIAIAATLAVVEPCSTGLGGDMFCLWYDEAQKKVSCINGSGKSPESLSWERIQEAHPNEDGTINKENFRDSSLAVTVPGAAMGWEDVYKKHGSGTFTFLQLLEPAIQFAEEGFPVAPITSYHWRAGMSQITKWLDGADENIPFMTDDGLPPMPGSIIRNPDMARVLRDLGTLGAAKGFYEGKTGEAIVEKVNKHGGCISMKDLQNHTSTFPHPIKAEYRGCSLWQVPPNGQGIAGLVALTGLAHLEEKGVVDEDLQVGSTEAYHVMMEMMRLGFADLKAHVADLDHMQVSTDWLLDKERIGARAEKLFDPDKAVVQGVPDASSCTVSFQVVDTNGNAISFVNSNFMGFGTGMVPGGCGFSLQNRGFGFSLEKGHPNEIGPGKRPFHTIIPGMLTHNDSNELYATLSNMGGNMQPQGHFQLTVDLLAGELDPQAAIDMPRFCIVDGTQQGKVFMEEGIDEDVIDELKDKGHILESKIRGQERSVFGRAQIIKRDRTTGVLWAGSDGRADGCAIGF